MCINPLKLPTNSTVISSVFAQKLYNYVPCGDCAECQQSKSREWLFRAHWQFEEVKACNGFALFDTLTYSNEFLPHLSQFLGVSEVDYPCFSLPDIQEFLNRLRILFRRTYHIEGELPLKYFLTSEYGTDERCTHRPHYHIILYCLDSSVNPLDISYMVSKCWLYGRTDGAKYNGKRYVLDKRVIRAHTKDGDSAHLHEYVAKYVEKDSEFSKVVRGRLFAYMFSLYQHDSQSHYVGVDSSNWLYDDDGFPLRSGLKYENDIDFIDWLKIPAVHSIYLKTKHLVEQFHKQSQGFGEYLLQKLDLPYLWKTGSQKFRLPNKNATYINVPLPMYYYRKLFQTQVYLADKLVWQYTELGKHFADIRKFHHVQYLADDIKNVFSYYNYSCVVDYSKLAEYSVWSENSIGWLRASTSVDDKLKFPHWFLKKSHGKFYISDFYYADDCEYCDFCIPFETFISMNITRNEFFDTLLDKYRELKSKYGTAKQEAFELKQKRRKLFKKQLSIF